MIVEMSTEIYACFSYYIPSNVNSFDQFELKTRLGYMLMRDLILLDILYASWDEHYFVIMQKVWSGYPCFFSLSL